MCDTAARRGRGTAAPSTSPARTIEMTLDETSMTSSPSSSSPTSSTTSDTRGAGYDRTLDATSCSPTYVADTPTSACTGLGRSRMTFDESLVFEEDVVGQSRSGILRSPLRQALAGGMGSRSPRFMDESLVFVEEGAAVDTPQARRNVGFSSSRVSLLSTSGPLQGLRRRQQAGGRSISPRPKKVYAHGGSSPARGHSPGRSPRSMRRGSLRSALSSVTFAESLVFEEMSVDESVAFREVEPSLIESLCFEEVAFTPLTDASGRGASTSPVDAPPATDADAATGPRGGAVDGTSPCPLPSEVGCSPIEAAGATPDAAPTRPRGTRADDAAKHAPRPQADADIAAVYTYIPPPTVSELERVQQQDAGSARPRSAARPMTVGQRDEVPVAPAAAVLQNTSVATTATSGTEEDASEAAAAQLENTQADAHVDALDVDESLQVVEIAGSPAAEVVPSACAGVEEAQDEDDAAAATVDDTTPISTTAATPLDDGATPESSLADGGISPCAPPQMASPPVLPGQEVSIIDTPVVPAAPTPTVDSMADTPPARVANVNVTATTVAGEEEEEEDAGELVDAPAPKACAKLHNTREPTANGARRSSLSRHDTSANTSSRADSVTRPSIAASDSQSLRSYAAKGPSRSRSGPAGERRSGGGWEQQLRASDDTSIRRRSHVWKPTNARRQSTATTTDTEGGYAGTDFGAPANPAPVPSRRQLHRTKSTDMRSRSFSQLRDIDMARRVGECGKCGETGHLAKDCPRLQKEGQWSSIPVRTGGKTGAFPPLPPVSPRMQARIERATPDLSGVTSKFRGWQTQGAAASRSGTPPPLGRGSSSAQLRNVPAPAPRAGLPSGARNDRTPQTARGPAPTSVPLARTMSQGKRAPPTPRDDPAPMGVPMARGDAVPPPTGVVKCRQKQNVIQRLQDENKKLQDAIEQMKCKMQNLETLGAVTTTTRGVGARAAAGAQAHVSHEAVRVTMVTSNPPGFSPPAAARPRAGSHTDLNTTGVDPKTLPGATHALARPAAVAAAEDAAVADGRAFSPWGTSDHDESLAIGGLDARARPFHVDPHPNDDDASPEPRPSHTAASIAKLVRQKSPSGSVSPRTFVPEPHPSTGAAPAGEPRSAPVSPRLGAVARPTGSSGSNARPKVPPIKRFELAMAAGDAPDSARGATRSADNNHTKAPAPAAAAGNKLERQPTVTGPSPVPIPLHPPGMTPRTGPACAPVGVPVEEPLVAKAVAQHAAAAAARTGTTPRDLTRTHTRTASPKVPVQRGGGAAAAASQLGGQAASKSAYRLRAAPPTYEDWMQHRRM